MEKENIPEEVMGRIKALSECLQSHPEDESSLIERGRLYWSIGRRSEAINDYLAAQKINPDGKATQLLNATYEILNFYHKDLYNP